MTKPWSNWRRRLWRILLPVSALFAAAPTAAGELPIFDTHLHYSRPAWTAFPPADALARLQAAGVRRAVVSGTPGDGALKLYRVDPDRFVPFLRPYRTRADMAGWFADPAVFAYVSAELEGGHYRGLGEFHLSDPAATGAPEFRRLMALAAARRLWLQVHADAAVVRALFELDPDLRVIWAHAGLGEPAAVVGETMAGYPTLIAGLSFRAGDIAPGGRLDPAWAALLTRHADRFTIGSDTYVNERWESYGAVIAEHRRWLALLPRTVAEAIAYGNALRLFGTR